MLKLLKLKVLTVATALLMAGSANSAFTLTVSSPGNISTGPFSTTIGPFGPGNVVGFSDFAPAANTALFVNYDITVNPAGGFFQINTLQFLYNVNPNALSFTATLTETAAAYPGAGNAAIGFTNYGSFGTPTGTFNSTTSFDAGTPIMFPNVNFTATPFNYIGSNSFVSPSNSGSVTLALGVTLPAFGNGNFDTSAGGTGLIGVQAGPVPVPATVLIGLFAVPALAVIRRRRGK